MRLCARHKTPTASTSTTHCARLDPRMSQSQGWQAPFGPPMRKWLSLHSSHFSPALESLLLAQLMHRRHIVRRRKQLFHSLIKQHTQHQAMTDVNPTTHVPRLSHFLHTSLPLSHKLSTIQFLFWTSRCQLQRYYSQKMPDLAYCVRKHIQTVLFRSSACIPTHVRCRCIRHQWPSPWPSKSTEIVLVSVWFNKNKI